MNRRLRVLLIGRHFWPHGSIDSAAYLIQLATDLSRRGIDVEVLTPQYASTWPTKFEFREFIVHRPIPAPRFDGAIARDWSVNRYVRLMANWLRDQGDSFDVLFVDRAREEVIAAIEAAKSLGCATLVRIGGRDAGSDIKWWQTSRLAGRCMGYTRRADSVVVKNSTEHRELIAGAFEQDRLCRIDDGFSVDATRQPCAKVAARRALAAINADLATPTDAPVAVCCAPMSSKSGIRVLIESVRVLVARYPELHFWFVGDGSYRDWMYDFLRGEGVRHAIAMPGSFAEMNDVFEAADVYIQTDGEGIDSLLRQAIAAELPVVAADIASIREVLTVPSQLPPEESGDHLNHDSDGEWISWYDPTKIKSLRMAVRRVLDDRRGSIDRAKQLRRVLCRRFPQHAAIDSYVQVFQRVSAASLSAAEANSIETAS